MTAPGGRAGHYLVQSSSSSCVQRAGRRACCFLRSAAGKGRGRVSSQHSRAGPSWVVDKERAAQSKLQMRVWHTSTPATVSPSPSPTREGLRGEDSPFARLDPTTACPVCRDPSVAPGETTVTVPFTTPHQSDSDRETLEQQVRALQERLAFYEGFDRLIQDNVAQSRELFRLAAQEREAAATVVDRARYDASRREAHLRGELELIACDLRQLSQIVETLADRVARALSGQPSQNGWQDSPLADAPTEQPVSVVVHGVPSAREALSLQRFIGSLPQVADVSAREFVGGVLRLD